MRQIPATKGRVILCDDEDYERLASLKWQARRSGNIHRPGHTDRVNGRQIVTFAHHAVLGRPPAGYVIDHINRDPWDNRRANLRVCSHAENTQNSRATRGVSRFKGVTYIAKRKRWEARITANGRHHYIGRFASEEDAARAYDAKARELHGEYAALNLPGEGDAAFQTGEGTPVVNPILAGLMGRRV